MGLVGLSIEFLTINQHLTAIETTTFRRNSSRLPSARVGKGGKMVLSDQQQGRQHWQLIR